MKKFLIALILGFTVNANAGLLLEPYLGYNSTEIDIAGADDATGLMIGARVGMTILSTVFIAVDYSTGDMSWDTDGDMTRLGVTVGADIPVAPLRAWVGYYQSKFEPGNSKFEGDGMKLGLGLTMLPIIDINLEYLTGEFDEINGTSISGIDETSFMLSLSAPFDL